MSMEMETLNPRKWRFTWEAQSHNPILKLFLFNPYTNPNTQCHDLRTKLNPTQTLLELTFKTEAEHEVSLIAPIPRVLIDGEAPLSSKTLDDHIEVRIVLLLPVDHPIVLGSDSVLGLERNGEESSVFEDGKPLSLDSDIEGLSGRGSVEFYCRNCSAKLTRNPISQFTELPSVDWQEVADNWFGACCCSFGGVSEKLVNRYTRSYFSSQGECLLNPSTVIICKDDLSGCEFPNMSLFSGDGSNGFMIDFGINNGKGMEFDALKNRSLDFAGKQEPEHLNGHRCSENLESTVTERKTGIDGASRFVQSEAKENGCCVHMPQSFSCDNENLLCDSSEHDFKSVDCRDGSGFTANQRSYLNTLLGNIFMARSYNLSTTVEWAEFRCPMCLTLLGSYPRADSCAPLDGGVRLFKCYVSTGLPAGGADDLFRKYTLHRMFANHILENAKDEISYRTTIKDMKTRKPVVQIVLLNPSSWYCTGFCSGIDDSQQQASRIGLQPAIKLLVCDCRNSSESQLRSVEEWVTKHSADEVFMLRPQIEGLVNHLVSANNAFPPFTFLQGFTLSILPR